MLAGQAVGRKGGRCAAAGAAWGQQQQSLADASSFFKLDMPQQVCAAASGSYLPAAYHLPVRLRLLVSPPHPQPTPVVPPQTVFNESSTEVEAVGFVLNGTFSFTYLDASHSGLATHTGRCGCGVFSLQAAALFAFLVACGGWPMQAICERPPMPASAALWYLFASPVPVGIDARPAHACLPLLDSPVSRSLSWECQGDNGTYLALVELTIAYSDGTGEPQLPHLLPAVPRRIQQPAGCLLI